MKLLFIKIIIIYLYLSTLSIIVLSIDDGQSIPTSPCPKIFQYRFDGSQWYGQLKITNPPINQSLKLKIILSVRGKPVTNYLGEIILLSRGQFKPVLYKVKFPLKQTPPRILQILVNSIVVCYGPADHGVFVTMIQLEHVRKFSYSGISDVNLQPTTESDYEDLFYDNTRTIVETTVKNLPVIQERDDSFLRSSNQLCGKQDEKILNTFDKNEKDIARGSWPWLAAIYINNLTTLSYQCGGTLISSKIVLTAAHCFHSNQIKYNANEILVFLGRYNLKNWNEPGSFASSTDEIYIHPDFDKNLSSYDADIAVIVLTDKVKFTEFIQPACLWSSSNNIEFIEHEKAVASGWGSNKHSLSSIPKKIIATIISVNDCVRNNQNMEDLLTNRTFCAKTMVNSNGPCTGDSGVGLFLNHNNKIFIRGIIAGSLPIKSSFTITQSLCGLSKYTIYTDIAQFLDWIYAFMI